MGPILDRVTRRVRSIHTSQDEAAAAAHAETKAAGTEGYIAMFPLHREPPAPSTGGTG